MKQEGLLNLLLYKIFDKVWNDRLGWWYAMTRIQGNNNSGDLINAFKNETVRYNWKFKIGKDFTIKDYISLFELSNNLLHLELKSEKNSDLLKIFYQTPVITQTLGTSSYIDRDKWYEAECIVNFNETGSIKFIIKDLKGKILLSVNSSKIETWQKELVCVYPYFGVYRNYIGAGNINDEETVYYTDISIQKL